MAVSTLPQLPTPNKPDSALYLALIQQPAPRWEKPYRHQRAIALFACSPEEVKVRLLLEGRVRTGEHCLQIVQAGAR